MDKITLIGNDIDIIPLKEYEKKKLWPGITATFRIYTFSFNGNEMLLLKNNSDISYTPLQQRKMAERIDRILHLPAVFYFDTVPTFERDRLAAQGVYFIVSNKFAYLPTLYANRRLSKYVESPELLPSAQYILLVHLQKNNLNGKTLKDLEEITPYKYTTISKAIKQLKSKGLVDTDKMARGETILKFESDLKRLWDKAQQYLTNPVKKIVYLPMQLNKGEIGGVSALSHYSMLAAENIPTRVFTKFDSKFVFTFEDVQRIEIWKYPPIIREEGYVDQLSLFLTLKNDKDPRIEKELEKMINQMLWLVD